MRLVGFLLDFERENLSVRENFIRGGGIVIGTFANAEIEIEAGIESGGSGSGIRALFDGNSFGVDEIVGE